MAIHCRILMPLLLAACLLPLCAQALNVSASAKSSTAAPTTSSVANDPAVARKVPRILFLHQEDLSRPFLTAQATAIRTAIASRIGEPIEINAEYLGLWRFREAGYREDLIRWLDRKYSGHRFNIIISVGPLALPFAQELRDQTFPDVPIIFYGVDHSNLEAGMPENSTGFVIIKPVRQQLELAQRILPRVRHLAVIGDHPGTEYSAGFSTVSFNQQLEELRGHIDVIDLSGLSVDAAKHRAANLPPDSVIYFAKSFGEDSDGKSYLPNAALEYISSTANAPILVPVGSLIGVGGLGGYVVQADIGANGIADMVRAILDGKRAADIPLTLRTVETPTFDGRLLDRWHIPDARLPQDSVILNRDIPIWKQYTREIAVIAFVILLQSLSIALLLIERHRRRKAELQALQNLSELAHLSRTTALGEMSTFIAHELNQPLGAIHSNTEAAENLLKQNPPDLEQVKEILADIRMDDRRASEIIGTMRELVRKSPFEKQEIDLNTLVRRIVEFLDWQIRTNSIGLRLDLASDLPPVMADRVQLEQVILNLVTNAIESIVDSQRDNGSIQIRTSLTASGTVELAVQDNGPGIAPEAASRIFEPYYTTKPQGMGMGLSIARAILEAHQSQLLARNRTEGGMLFQFALQAMHR